MTPLSNAERAYDNWVTTTDVCQECGERYYMGEPCGCPEEEDEDETLEANG